MDHPHPSGVDLPGPLVLASASPRRRELLGLLGVPFEVEPADVDERPRPGEQPRDLVRRLASDKATLVSRRRPSAVVVGADTVVVAGEAVFGKPGDDDEARTMLRALSARTHRVFTGVVVARLGTVQHELAVVTDVTMVDLDASLVEWYVGTGEWRGKAGGYAIQGCGGALVRAVQGSVSSVVGLPVAELADVLRLSGGR